MEGVTKEGGITMNSHQTKSLVHAFLTFVIVFTVAIMSALLGYHFGVKDNDASPYIERCRIVRQHAFKESESEVLTKAIVMTVDFIEQVRTPGFHREMPQIEKGE